MIATQASPGQGTLQIASEKAPQGSMAVIVVRNRKSGEAFRYAISEDWPLTILDWNKLDPVPRFGAAMAAEGLFRREPAP